MADGASFVKKGENGKGIASRWYPATLKRRILAIDGIKERISFIQGDAFEVCRRHAGRKDVVYFIDPPYTKAGRRLYRHSEIDHAALFELASELVGNFLMTYDDAEEIRDLAKRHDLFFEAVPMKNTHHAEKKELLISNDLSWLTG